MEVKSEDIKVIITANGWTIIGIIDNPDYGVWNENELVTLNYPFRLIPLDRSVAFAALVAKEEWVTISMKGAMEVKPNSQLKDLYKKYYEQEFGSGIIIPTNKVIV